MKFKLVAPLMSKCHVHCSHRKTPKQGRWKDENSIWCLFKWGKLRVYKYVGVNLAVRYNFSMYPFNQMQDELLQATKQLSIPLIHDSIVLHCLYIEYIHRHDTSELIWL